MGHRMEFYVDETVVQELISISKSFNVDAQIIGRVKAASEKKLTLKTANKSYEYL